MSPCGLFFFLISLFCVIFIFGFFSFLSTTPFLDPTRRERRRGQEREGKELKGNGRRSTNSKNSKTTQKRKEQVNCEKRADKKWHIVTNSKNKCTQDCRPLSSVFPLSSLEVIVNNEVKKRKTHAETLKRNQQLDRLLIQREKGQNYQHH